MHYRLTWQSKIHLKIVLSQPPNPCVNVQFPFFIGPYFNSSQHCMWCSSLLRPYNKWAFSFKSCQLTKVNVDFGRDHGGNNSALNWIHILSVLNRDCSKTPEQKLWGTWSIFWIWKKTCATAVAQPFPGADMWTNAVTHAHVNHSVTTTASLLHYNVSLGYSLTSRQSGWPAASSDWTASSCFSSPLSGFPATRSKVALGA